MTTHQNTSVSEGTSFSKLSQNIWGLVADALDPFQLRDQHLLKQVADDIKNGSLALDDATRIVLRAVDPVSDQLRDWYSASDLKTVQTCYALVRQYDAAAVDREGEQLLEKLERLGERLGAEEEEHPMADMPAITLDLQAELAMVAAALRYGPISEEWARDIVGRALASPRVVGSLDKRHLEPLAICLLATDDGDLNNIFGVEESDRRQCIRNLLRVGPIAELKETMDDAGVDFLAVASRVAQGRYPLLGGEISDIDLATRNEWLNDILNGIEDASGYNRYDTARLLLKAHALTECGVAGTEQYINSIFTETGEIIPEVREELADLIRGESLVDQAVMVMRLRSEVRIAAEHLRNMVTDYDYTLRTDGKMVQQGLIDLTGGHQIMMDQFADFFRSETGEDLLPDSLVRRFKETFEKDVYEMLGRFAAEFYNPTSAKFIAAFDQWRKNERDSYEISDGEYNNLVSALIADFANGSGHPEALFDRYITARDFIREETSAPTSDEQLINKISTRLLLLKELELCVVSGLIEASWTEELEQLKEPLADLQRGIIDANNDGNPNSQFRVPIRSIGIGIEQFWNRFGKNVEKLAERCILNEAEMAEILSLRYGPIFTDDINEFLASLGTDNNSDYNE